MTVLKQQAVFDVEALQVGHAILMQRDDNSLTRQIGIITDISPVEMKVGIAHIEQKVFNDFRGIKITPEEVEAGKVLIKHLHPHQLWNQLQQLEVYEEERAQGNQLQAAVDAAQPQVPQQPKKEESLDSGW